MSKRSVKRKLVCAVVFLSSLVLLMTLTIAVMQVQLRQATTFSDSFPPPRPAARKLGQGYANVVDIDAKVASTGCVTVSLDSASVTKSLDTLACNGMSCPTCFIITHADNTNSLTLGKCSSMYVSGTQQAGSSADVTSPYRNFLQEYHFVNRDTAKDAIILDGVGGKFSISPLGAAVAFCYTDGRDHLEFVGATGPYMNAGEVADCPGGTSTVTSKAECQLVSNLYGNGDAVEELNDGAWPNGCVYRVWQTFTFWWNTATPGVARAGREKYCRTQYAA